MHGRQDTGAAAMGESGPIAAIVPQVAVDQLAFEDVALEMTAIAAAVLHDDIAQAEIIKVVFIAFAKYIDAVPILAVAENVEPLDQHEVRGGGSVDAQDPEFTPDLRDQAGPSGDDRSEETPSERL